MWGIAIIIPVVTILVVWTWEFINWVWIKPRKIERLFRKQGMNGNSYKFLYGDSKEASLMYKNAYSKPIGLYDDIAPRIMPKIHHTIQEYGNYSFTWYGPRPRIFIMDCDVAREVLMKHHVYAKPFKIDNPIVKLLATGIGSLEGEEWTKTRSRLNPTFNMDKLKPMVPAIQQCCEDTLNKWKELVSKDGNDGSSCVIDVFIHLENITAAILAQLMFSSPYTEQIKQTFLQLSELAVLAALPSKIFTLPGQRYLPTQTNRRGKEIDKYVHDSIASLINDRLLKRKSSTSGNWDLLDAFLEELYDGNIDKDSEGGQRIIEDAIGECRIFFFAGFETSSNLLTWTMILLSIHQDWQARAREEVSQVLGNKKHITSDDLAKLKIVTMILNEVLRFYAPVMEITRLVKEETKIKGYTIPKDTLLTFPILLYHRKTEIWGEDALEFKPDRFAEGVLKATNGEAGAYMPFGWGPRICIGQNFALLESKTFLAMLLRDFSFELSPTYTHAPVVAFTMRPQFGAPLLLRKL